MDYKVKLDVFEGPLDLLLYLIKKNEIDIHDIPITLITEQYLEYINLMQLLDLEVAGEFLIMAATLLHIKSKLLLPVTENPEEELTQEMDPRFELVQKLLEYMKYKEAAKDLKSLEEERAKLFTRIPPPIELEPGENILIEVTIFELISAFSKVLKEMPKDVFHQVIKDEFTVAEKVYELVEVLKSEQRVRFSRIFKDTKNKLEAITIFLALLELVRLKEVSLYQNELFDDIDIEKAQRLTEPSMEDEIEDQAFAESVIEKVDLNELLKYEGKDGTQKA